MGTRGTGHLTGARLFPRAPKGVPVRHDGGAEKIWKAAKSPDAIFSRGKSRCFIEFMQGSVLNVGQPVVGVDFPAARASCGSAMAVDTRSASEPNLHPRASIRRGWRRRLRPRLRRPTPKRKSSVRNPGSNLRLHRRPSKRARALHPLRRIRTVALSS
jgi:hypothetical protein